MEPSPGLSPLQIRILTLLAGLTPPWRLTGGGALAAEYTRHRTTRDLDLFWSTADLGDLGNEAESLLRADGLDVERSLTSPAHVRLTVADAGERTVLDLVADPVPTIVPTVVITVGGGGIRADAPYEILVNKLCALLGRSELRDLADVVALRGIGLDFVAALQDAPRKDSGFSPLTLAWVLQNLDVVRLGHLEGWDARRVAEMDRARLEILTATLDAVSEGDQT